jgi:aspartate kinase
MPRVHSLEAVELAENGAKVMHARGAELAHRTATPYTIKGLRSNVGTTIDDKAPVDHDRPVTGIAVLHNIAFVHLMPRSRGVDPRAPKIELAVFQRLAENDVSIDMINVNDAGIFFICDAENVETIKRELRELDVEFRLRPHCAKLSIVGIGMRGTPGVMYRVVRAVVEANAEIIHSTDSNITISILVDEDDAARAEQSVHDFFKLGQLVSAKEALA